MSQPSRWVCPLNFKAKNIGSATWRNKWQMLWWLPKSEQYWRRNLMAMKWSGPLPIHSSNPLTAKLTPRAWSEPSKTSVMTTLVAAFAAVSNISAVSRPSLSFGLSGQTLIILKVTPQPKVLKIMLPIWPIGMQLQLVLQSNGKSLAGCQSKKETKRSTKMNIVSWQEIPFLLGPLSIKQTPSIH